MGSDSMAGPAGFIWKPFSSAAVRGGAGSGSARAIAAVVDRGGFGAGGTGKAAISGLDRCESTRPPKARLIAPTAKRTGRNSAKARLLTPFDRSDGEGRSVMTTDLLGVR